MTKHQKYFQEMVESNKVLFDSFRQIHDKYVYDESFYREEFNHIGEKVVAVIRDFEKMLCSKSDSGQFSKYSTNLSDKFWEVVRTQFPRIDFVGVK